MLGREPEEVTLLEAYEAIDGPLRPNTCLMGHRVCRDHGCILGGLLEEINRDVRQHLSNQRLSDLTHVFTDEEESGGEQRAKEDAA